MKKPSSLYKCLPLCVLKVLVFTRGRAVVFSVNETVRRNTRCLSGICFLLPTSNHTYLTMLVS
jgi:hypothetical protein